jgi:hypothetical protein
MPERRAAAAVADKPKKMSLKERLSFKKSVGKKGLPSVAEPETSVAGTAAASSGSSEMKTVEDALAEKEGR